MPRIDKPKHTPHGHAPHAEPVPDVAPPAPPVEDDEPMDRAATFRARCQEIAKAELVTLVGNPYTPMTAPYSDHITQAKMAAAPGMTPDTLMQKVSGGYVILGAPDGRIFRRDPEDGLAQDEWRDGRWSYYHKDTKDDTEHGWKPTKEWRKWRRRYSR